MKPYITFTGVHWLIYDPSRHTYLKHDSGAHREFKTKDEAQRFLDLLEE